MGFLAAGILHQLQNLCHGGIIKLLCDLHPQKAAAVDTAADDVVSLRYLTGHGLTGQR